MKVPNLRNEMKKQTILIWERTGKQAGQGRRGGLFCDGGIYGQKGAKTKTAVKSALNGAVVTCRQER